MPLRIKKKEKRGFNQNSLSVCYSRCMIMVYTIFNLFFFFKEHSSKIVVEIITGTSFSVFFYFCGLPSIPQNSSFLSIGFILKDLHHYEAEVNVGFLMVKSFKITLTYLEFAPLCTPVGTGNRKMYISQMLKRHFL